MLRLFFAFAIAVFPMNFAMAMDIAELKEEIIRIAGENTTRLDNFEEIREELDPLVDELESYFAANRPGDETDLVQGVWRSIWFDDPNIGGRLQGVELDRTQTYQVIYGDFYYNVANSTVNVFGQKRAIYHTYLKGNYQIKDPANESNLGEKRINIVDLTFDKNKLKWGSLQTEGLFDRVLEVDQGEIRALGIPGPEGIKGQFWNAYLDEDLRISKGIQEGAEDRINLYILVRE